MKTTDELKRGYSKFAKGYDAFVIRKTKYTAHKRIPQQVSALLRNDQNRVLDLGCGTGLSSQVFFRRKFEVTGIDLAPGMIKEARKRPFKKLICQDLETPLKVRENYFDAVLLIGVMEFIRSPLKFLRNVRKALKDEGVFGLTIPAKLSKNSKLDIQSYYKKEIEPIFKKAGFQVLKSERFFGYNKIKVGEPVEYYGYILRKK